MLMDLAKKLLNFLLRNMKYAYLFRKYEYSVCFKKMNCLNLNKNNTDEIDKD